MLSGCNKKVTIPRRDMTNETCEAGLMCGMSGSHSDEPVLLTSWLVGFTVIVEGQQEIPPQHKILFCCLSSCGSSVKLK